MRLEPTEYQVLQLYEGGAPVTVEDVAREMGLTQSQAAEACSALVGLGCLSGSRRRKITDEGRKALSTGEVDDVPKDAAIEVADSGEGSQRSLDDPKKPKLSDALADRLMIDKSQLLDIVRRSVIQVGRGEEPPTNAEVYHVLSTMHKYELDPWMRQLHAFRSDGKLQVMLGYDGWVDMATNPKRNAQRSNKYLGATYDYGPMQDPPEHGAKPCHAWVSCTVESTGRRPTTVTAYLDEWYRPMPRSGRPGPWQKYTKHRLRQKAFCMAVREHFGVALLDPDDYEQMQMMRYEEAKYEDIGTKSERIAGQTSARMLEIMEQAKVEREMEKARAETEIEQNEDDERAGEPDTEPEAPRPGALDQRLFETEGTG